jgi:hypothetical protein
MHLKNLLQHVKVVVEAKGNKVHLQRARYNILYRKNACVWNLPNFIFCPRLGG